MDATEKILDCVAAARSSWVRSASTRRDYSSDEWIAHALLAAFPQLALEGREEWANAWGKQPIQTVLEKHARDASESYGVPLLKRIFWEQPWAEVQS